jgi:hypothetical protein
MSRFVLIFVAAALLLPSLALAKRVAPSVWFISKQSFVRRASRSSEQTVI